MTIVLTVIENFLEHVKGDIIADAQKIRQYVGSEWESHFIKTAAPEVAPQSSGPPAE